MCLCESHLAEAFLLSSSLYIVFILSDNYFKHFCAIFLPQWVTIPPCHIKSLTGENRASHIHATTPRYPDTASMPLWWSQQGENHPCVYIGTGAQRYHQHALKRHPATPFPALYNHTRTMYICPCPKVLEEVNRYNPVIATVPEVYSENRHFGNSSTKNARYRWK